jgi:hypothetical protein
MLTKFDRLINTRFGGYRTKLYNLNHDFPAVLKSWKGRPCCKFDDVIRFTLHFIEIKLITLIYFKIESLEDLITA